MLILPGRHEETRFFFSVCKHGRARKHRKTKRLCRKTKVVAAWLKKSNCFPNFEKYALLQLRLLDLGVVLSAYVVFQLQSIKNVLLIELIDCLKNTSFKTNVDNYDD